MNNKDSLTLADSMRASYYKLGIRTDSLEVWVLGNTQITLDTVNLTAEKSHTSRQVAFDDAELRVLAQFGYRLSEQFAKDTGQRIEEHIASPASTVTTLVHLNIESKQPLTAQHIEHIKDAVAYILNERAEVVSVDCPLYEEI